jgi:hypothetical protein
LVFEKRDTSFLEGIWCQVLKNDGDTKIRLILAEFLKNRTYGGFIVWCQVFPETLYFLVISLIFRFYKFSQGFEKNVTQEKCGL